MAGTVSWYSTQGASSPTAVVTALRIVEDALAAARNPDAGPAALQAILDRLGATAAWLLRRTDRWVVYQAAGPAKDDLDCLQRHERLLSEAQEQDAVGYVRLSEAAEQQTEDANASGVLILCPFDERLCPNTALVVRLGPARASAEELVSALAVARRALSGATYLLEEGKTLRRQALDLRLLLETTRRLGTCRDTAELLEAIAAAATEMLDAERASIFIWDREAHEVVARPALGITGQDLRLPDDYGIVGQVLHSGEPLIVNDAAAHPAFRADVDRKTGFRTRSLLAVPLVDPAGSTLGVFEALNKRSGPFTARDRWLLERLAEQVAVVLQNTEERERLARVATNYAEHQAEAAMIVGTSRATRELRATIQRLAQTDLPVLIQGESGTGKEVVARAIHLQSARSRGPFIAVNCAAIAETLLESELFGHERGAFTDARESRPGKFELAEGGTLFLDEIGDMSLQGQAKLLRVLEEKGVYRVGGTKLIPVNVRVIAATNRDLAQRVADGQFREDLFFRLSVVTIQLPPLRQRREDILALADYFLARFCRDAGRSPLRLTDKARQRLLEHDWPGNVRELRNLMERLAFLAPGPTIDVAEIEQILAATTLRKETPGVGVPAGLTLSQATAEFQRRYIREAIERAGGNVAEAGRLLGIHRANLYRKMKQLGMNRSPKDTQD